MDAQASVVGQFDLAYSWALSEPVAISAPRCHIRTMKNDMERAMDAFVKARGQAKQKLAEAIEVIIGELERRGYDVKGKSLAEINELLRKPPTKPKSNG